MNFILKQHNSRFQLLLLLCVTVMGGTVFGFSPADSSRLKRNCNTFSLAVTRDEYMQPHFEVHERKHNTPTIQQNFDLSRMMECAESTTGECSLSEMEEMMDELQSYLDGSNRTLGQHAKILKSLESQVKKTSTLSPNRDLEELLSYMHSIAEQEVH